MFVIQKIRRLDKKKPCNDESISLVFNLASFINSGVSFFKRAMNKTKKIGKMPKFLILTE